MHSSAAPQQLWETALTPPLSYLLGWTPVILLHAMGIWVPPVALALKPQTSIDFSEGMASIPYSCQHGPATLLEAWDLP